MKEEYIKNTPLFGELTDDEQRAIGKRMRLEEYGPNEALFLKNGESDALYLIKEGWVKLSDGERSPVVATLGPGSLLGETDFFGGQPYAMTARTSSPATVWALDSAALTGLIDERPELGLYLGLAFGKGIVQYQERLSAHLSGIPLLQDLSDRERRLLAQYLSPHRYFSAETIYRSGDPATGLFFIESGAVRLLGDTDDDFAELSSGEAFGEMAVISNTPHSNTAQAANEVVLWQLSPADFTTLSKTYPSIKTNLSRNLRARLSGSDQAYAVAVLGRISLFSSLSRETLNDIVRLLLLRHVPAGESIFSQGDPGDAMYIVDTGAVIADSPDRPGQMQRRFGDGDYFGETALLTGKTRDFTAHAAGNTNLWCLYRTDFDSLLVKHPQISTALSQALRDRLSSADEQSIEPHLQKIAMAAGLSRTQLDELSARLQPRRYQGGSTVYHEGSASEEMYFIERGQVELWATAAQGPILLETLEQGDYFGEIALLSGRGNLGTAYALVATEVWALNRVDFDDFLQRYPNLGVTLSRIFSERMEETMSRMRGGPAQRSLPAPLSPGAIPPTSRPVPPAPSQSGYASPSRPFAPPSRPMTPVSRPPTSSMPPVPVRPIAPPRGSRPMAALPPRTSSTSGIPAQPRPPVHSQYTQPMPPVPPPSTPPGRSTTSFHSQNTMGMPPVPPSGSSPSVHSQNTMGMAPVPPPSNPAQSVHSQNTMGMAPVPPPSQPQPAQQAAAAPSKKRKKVRRKKKRKSTGAQSTNQPVQAAAVAGAAAVPALPPPQQTGSTPANTRKDSKKSKSAQPRSYSNRRIERHRKSMSVWFANRTLGAKLRLLAFAIAIVWLCGIMVPSFIINALASTFADEGALPGDGRSAFQQISEDGASGAVAVLPFVETATATPTNTPTRTPSPTTTPTPTNTPIPTNTPTPTLTPTPTDTPTPEFTPTPTDTATPTRVVVVVPSEPTDTPTPEPTPTPDVDFRVKSVRQLTPCENQGKHHIFVKVEDAAGQGINGVPVKVEWSPVVDGNVLINTETKTDLVGQLDPGRFDFAMFKGSYVVEVMGGSSEVAGPVTPDYGTNEPCGDNAVANSLFHLSYEIIFQRTY